MSVFWSYNCQSCWRVDPFREWEALTAASRGANSFYLIEGLVFVSILMNLWGDTLLSMLKKNEKFTSNCNKLTSGLLPEIFAFSCRKCYCFAYSTKGKLIVMNLGVGIFEKTIKLYYTTWGPFFNKYSKPIKVYFLFLFKSCLMDKLFLYLVL